jgi:hypothetical protein
VQRLIRVDTIVLSTIHARTLAVFVSTPIAHSRSRGNFTDSAPKMALLCAYLPSVLPSPPIRAARK